MVEPTGLEALRQATTILKSCVEVGRVVDRTHQAVSEMLRKGGQVPAEWCIPLEKATEQAGQKIHRSQFRPDIWPEDFARLSKQQAPRRHAEQPRSKPRAAAVAR
jgi:DNA-binding transcriptional regulator YdaS (Cro superfamily)